MRFSILSFAFPPYKDEGRDKCEGAIKAVERVRRNNYEAAPFSQAVNTEALHSFIGIHSFIHCFSGSARAVSRLLMDFGHSIYTQRRLKKQHLFAHIVAIWK
jgi:hypothetical protein